MEKIKHLNLNAIFKALILLGFSAFFVYSVLQGTITKYVHPRMIPFIIAASIVMCITAILLCLRIFKSKESGKFNLSLIIYVIPLITAFCFPAVSFDSSNVTSGNYQFEENNNSMPSDTESTYEVPKSTKNSIKKNNSLILDNSNFYTELYSIYESPKDYAGKKIELTGFVFKDDSYSENEFVSARLVMVCCAADMVTTGFLCEYENASGLELNSWVKVSGILGVKEIDDELTPYIKAASVENTEKPKMEYIYPY